MNWRETIESYRPLPAMSSSERTRMAVLAKKGNALARERLVRSCVPFVARVAQRYYSDELTPGDLISAGMEGLVYAVEKYSPERDTDFLSYAVWWVRQRITRILYDESRTVRVPSNVILLAQRAARGSEPTPEQLQALEAVNACSRLERIDRPAEMDDGKTRPWDLRQDEESTAACIDHERSRRLAEVLASLTPVQRHVMVRHYGLDGGPEESYSSIGRGRGWSRERARQVHREALDKLRRTVKAERFA